MVYVKLGGETLHLNFSLENIEEIEGVNGSLLLLFLPQNFGYTSAASIIYTCAELGGKRYYDASREGYVQCITDIKDYLNTCEKASEGMLKIYAAAKYGLVEEGWFPKAEEPTKEEMEEPSKKPLTVADIPFFRSLFRKLTLMKHMGYVG